MKTALVGGGIFAAAYVAAGMLYYRKTGRRNPSLLGSVIDPLKWPLTLWSDRKSARVADGGATLKDAAKSALAGTTAGVEIRR